MKKPDYSYCFVATRDRNVAEAAGRLGLDHRGEAGERRILFAAPRGFDDRYTASLNDIGDYDIDRVRESLLSGGTWLPGFDSLVSAAFRLEKAFACAGDFWGINSHYWFRDGSTFCCSDNVFMVAAITGADLSRESIWEYLFFLSPTGDRSWFRDVKKLRSGETLLYDAESHEVSLADRYDPESVLIDSQGPELGDALASFFGGAGRVLSGRRAAVSISAGSDSNTVLSCVRGFGIPHVTYSFGEWHLVETRQIELNSRRLGFDWTLVDISTFRSSWHDRFRRTLIGTNGLLNPFRTHYEEYYDVIPSNNAIFEGVMGSQFLKGEFAVGSTISRGHRTAITTNEPLDTIVEREFEGLPEPFRKEMIEYITDVHGANLKDVNTPEGFRAFRSWAFEFIPGRIFSGIILLAAKDHDVYEPFISPMILKSLYRCGLGFVRDLNFRSAYGGPVASLEPEALIVRETDGDVFDLVLDRGVSFREVLGLSSWRLGITRKRRNAMRKLRYRNYRFGQVDNKAVRDQVGEYAMTLGGSHPLVDALIEGGRWSKEAATLGMILETVRTA